MTRKVYEIMTIERARALKPGDNLYWEKRKPHHIRGGVVGEEAFASSYGNPVTFVSFTGTSNREGYPGVNVKTKKGIETFGSGWFE
jgi:hypothetical protein